MFLRHCAELRYLAEKMKAIFIKQSSFDDKETKRSEPGLTAHLLSVKCWYTCDEFGGKNESVSVYLSVNL